MDGTNEAKVEQMSKCINCGKECDGHLQFKPSPRKQDTLCHECWNDKFKIDINR